MIGRDPQCHLDESLELLSGRGLLASDREKGHYECHQVRMWAVTRQNPKVMAIVNELKCP